MFVRILYLGTLILLLSACTQNQPEETDRLISDGTVKIDSCAIALARDDQAGNNARIRQYQNAVNRNQQPLVNLEKLGWAYVSLARIFFDDGYYNLALATSRCILEKHAEHDAALMLQAYVAQQLHRFNDAETLAKQLVEKRGYWFEYGILGDALMEQGRLDEAEQAYQSMMNQRPGPQAYSRAAHLRWLKGDLKGAIEMAQLTVSSYGHGNNEPANWAKSRLGFYLLLNSKLAGANHVIDQTLKIDNDYAPALFIKGRLYLAQNKPEKAIMALQKAVELNPVAEYQWVLIEAFTAAGKHDQAQLAKAQFEKNAVTLDPRTYALYLATTGRNNALALQLAAEEFDQRQDIFSRDALAWALYTNNQASAARDHIQNALKNGTHDPRLYYHAALINLAVNNTSEAGKWYNKALVNRHLLLPSERLDLKKKFANFNSHKPPLETAIDGDKENLTIKGDQNENSI